MIREVGAILCGALGCVALAVALWMLATLAGLLLGLGALLVTAGLLLATGASAD